MEVGTVDIVIPCYNGERYLAQTLERALAQTYRSVRILVVDDGSTDSTRRIVESYRGRVGYVFKENGGQASARNLGVARTLGDYLCLLDADDLPAPDMIERLVIGLEREPLADLAHADVLGFWGDDSRYPHAEFWRPRVTWDSYLEPLSVLCALHCSATLMRRKVFGKFGLFSEQGSHRGCEDWVFFLNAVLQGAVIVRVPEVLCLYRYHSGASSASGKAVAYRESTVMRSALSLFRRAEVSTERAWAFLAIGFMSVASRWLALGDHRSYSEMYSQALSIAPASLFGEEIGSASSASGPVQAALLNLRLSDMALELGSQPLAAVLFLRCRHWSRLRSMTTRFGQRPMLERVSRAMSMVVTNELRAQGEAPVPSYATYLAGAMGSLSRSAGRNADARDRFREACLLDPNHTWPLLCLIGMDLMDGQVRSAELLWRELDNSRDVAAPAYRLRRALRAVLLQMAQRHPRVRELVRIFGECLSWLDVGIRRVWRRA